MKGEKRAGVGDRWVVEACRSAEELVALVRAARERDAATSGASQRYADLAERVTICVLLGLRKSEATALGWDDVEIDNPAAAWVRLRHRTQNGWRERHPEWTRPRDLTTQGTARTVRLSACQGVALWAQRENVRRAGLYYPDGPVFPAVRDGAAAWRSTWTIIDTERELRPCVKAAGLPNVEGWDMRSLRISCRTILDRRSPVAGVDELLIR
jgi:integrase